MTQPITYAAPNFDYSADLERLQNRQKLADAMRDQSFQPVESQMAGGWVIPTSPLSGVAKLAQALSSKYQTDKITEEKKAIAGKMQTDLADVYRRGGEAMASSPARPANNDVMQSSQSLDSFDGNPAQPAREGSLSAASAIYSTHPETRALAQSLMQQDVKSQGLLRALGIGQQAAPAGGAPDMPTQGSPQGAPQQSVQGLYQQLSPQDQQIVQGMARSGDEAGVWKFISDRFKPSVTADGKAITTTGGRVNVLPGSVDAMQAYADVLNPVQKQQMAQAGAEYFDKTGKDLPGFAQGKPSVAPTAASTPSGYLGPQPNGRFQGDPAVIAAQIAQIKDPNERAAAMQAMRNQAAGTNPQPDAALRAGTDAMRVPATRLGPQAAAPVPVAGATPSGISPAQQRELAVAGPKEFDTGRAKNMVDYEKGLNARVTEGGNLNMRMQQSIEALDKFRSGGGAESYQKLAQVAQGLGAPPDVVGKIMGGGPDALAASQVFSKLAAQEAMETLKQSMGGAGRIAQAEFKVFQQNNPNISTDPDAIRKIFDFNTRVYKQDLAEQESFGNFVKSNNPADFPAHWAKESAKLGFTNPTLSAQPVAAPQRRSSDAMPVKKFNPTTGKIE